MEAENSKLFNELSHIIEEGKRHIVSQVNKTLTLVYWKVGNRINEEVLQDKRADYGKEVVAILSQELGKRYGRGFSLRNIRRMIQFSQLFSDFEIVSTLSAQLSWSHFIELLRIKNEEARYFYAKETTKESWGVRTLRRQIELLEMGKDGIMVAEYWTDLPPKKELEEKLHLLLVAAKERIEQRRLMK